MGRPDLCVLLVLMGPVRALTATPGGLSVTQSPPSLSVMRGETATLLCHFKVESLKRGVQWFKMKPDKRLVETSGRRSIVESNRTSSLVIADAALEDSGWFYCEVNVLHKDPERGNGTELLVLAPPSPPRIYLPVPPNPQTGPWGLLCVTGGFHPNTLNLTWTWTSRSGAGTSQPPVAGCALPGLRSDADPSERPADGALSSDAPAMPVTALRSECFQVTDERSRELFLVSVLVLPARPPDTGATFTCEVRDHPAIADALAASYTWEAAPNQLILHLNILKTCLLSAAAAVLSLAAARRLRKRGK